MLNRELLIKELSRISDGLFFNDTHAYQLAYNAWNELSNDVQFQNKIRTVSTPWLIPSWEGSLNEFFSIAPIDSYLVSSVDGSQIYPDRHQGLSCFLINVGAVSLRYNTDHKPVSFSSEPYIFTGQEDELELEVSAELVNCKRQDLELQMGVKLSKYFQYPSCVLLFDGSLIFWHLEAKDLIFQEAFLSKYIHSLLQLYKAKVITASYISAPKSKELMNLLKLYLADYDYKKVDAYKSVEHLTDGSLLHTIIPEFHRTLVFKNHSKVSELYPDAVHPHFFYLNVGSEIGRVEIPEWIAKDEALVNHVAQVVLDQCKKGSGYPVVLAEAHEQAVVKSVDREFFYHLITRLGIERKHTISMSQKLTRKKGMSI